MCCRYWIESSDETARLVEQMNHSPLLSRFEQADPHPAVRRSGEVFPGDAAPVIAPDREGKAAVFPMKWGFSGKSLLINARSETANMKPTFREAWQRHRCIIPASWYFEWEHLTDEKGRKKTGNRYRICPKKPEKSGLTNLCGLYRIENGLPVFVVLTRQPGESIRFIHDRMPLILPDRSALEWILPGSDPDRILKDAVTNMDAERVSIGY